MNGRAMAAACRSHCDPGYMEIAVDAAADLIGDGLAGLRKLGPKGCSYLTAERP